MKDDSPIPAAVVPATPTTATAVVAFDPWEFSDRVQAFERARGLSGRKAAKLAHVPRSTYHAVTRGIRLPSRVTLSRIQTALESADG